MDQAALVSLDFERGREVVEALDRTTLKLAVALWAVLPEYGDWRLVLAAREFDSTKLRDAYRLIHDSLAAAGVAAEHTLPLMILPMTDPFIKKLRQIFGKTKSCEGMRLGGQMIGNRFIEDAYVYRIR
jgi:hypothetical protein